MRTLTKTLISLVIPFLLYGQGAMFFGGNVSGSVPITLDASCTGFGTANLLSCSGAMTVTAGDTIGCNVTGVSGGNNLTGTVMDPVNGFYKNGYGRVHPSSSTSWTTWAYKDNSAGGSITPILFYSNTPNVEGTISCYAWKGVPTSSVLDCGSVTQTNSATATNPTSGSAQAPTNNNEAVVAYMSRSSGTAPSSGGGAWLPAGTLTLVGTTNVRQASEYQIQTTATAVNGPFTATGTAVYVDSQFALLQAGTTGGCTSVTGFFVPLGAAGSAPTGTVTTTTLGGATSTLATSQFSAASPYWTQGGATAPTYDTGVNPTGTKKIMVAGVAHTFGDAGSSVMYAGGTAAGNSMSIKDDFTGYGQAMWWSSFYRLASSGLSNGQVCDIMAQAGGVTDQFLTLQMQYDTTLGVGFDIEPTENGSSQILYLGNGLRDTDIWLQLHVASVNERYHQVLVYTASGGVWSLLNTLNYDHLCTNGSHALCTTPTPQATPTGTASSGATALTISSGTGTVTGQLALDPTNGCIPWPTLVEAGGGTTSITLSQNTTCTISGTTVNFYTVPANLSVATNGTVSAGSTALTVVAPGTGTIATGQSIGGSGIAPGTTVAAVSGTSVTLSIPSASAMTSGGVSFWAADGNGNTSLFGKYSSCSVSSNQWWSNMFADPFGTSGAFAPN